VVQQKPVRGSGGVTEASEGFLWCSRGVRFSEGFGGAAEVDEGFGGEAEIGEGFGCQG